MPHLNMQNAIAGNSPTIANVITAMIEPMKYWITFKFEAAQAGKRVLARPNSRGEAFEGVILQVLDYGIVVQYGTMSSATELHDSGRWNTEFETTLDVILIEA